jgi:carbamoyl-phosphate synthase large subunit
MLSGEIDLVFNTAHGVAAIQDSLSLRQTALTNNIPYYTTMSGSRAAVAAIRALQKTKLSAKSIQDYLHSVSS